MKTILAKNEKFDYFSKESVNINSCGFQNNSDYSIIRKNGRSDYHLLYVYSGSCTVTFDKKGYTLFPGNFVLYYPGQTQKYSFDDKCCTTLWLHFSGIEVGKILRDLGLLSGVYSCNPSEKIAPVFKELVKEFNINRDANKFVEKSFLVYLLVKISRHVCDNEKHNDIGKVIMLMRSDISAKYEPDVYAAMCSLSVSRFAHKFKDVTGKPPLKYFIDIKMERSMELLEFSSLKISDISEMTGYDNPLYFSRLFKKHTGLSPLEYRRRCGRNNFEN